MASRWLPWGWLWVGVAMVVFGLQPYLDGHLLLGNVNHLILASLVAFSWAHMEGHQRAAGRSCLARQSASRSGPSCSASYSCANAAGKSCGGHWGSSSSRAGFCSPGWAWDVLPSMIAALTAWLPTVPNDVLWTSWARYWWGWPDWIGLCSGSGLGGAAGQGDAGL